MTYAAKGKGGRAVACVNPRGVLPDKSHYISTVNWLVEKEEKKPLDDEMRYRLLKLLEQNPHMNQRELACEMGISLGKINYCINALIEKGWVKAGSFYRNKNKMKYAYLLTPKGVQEKARVTVRFLKRKQGEYDALLVELDELRREAAALNLLNDI